MNLQLLLWLVFDILLDCMFLFLHVLKLKTLFRSAAPDSKFDALITPAMLLANNIASFSSFLQDVMVPVACPTGRFQRRAIIHDRPHKIKPTSMDRSEFQLLLVFLIFLGYDSTLLFYVDGGIKSL